MHQSLRIDIGKAIQSKAPKMHRRLPKFMIRWAEKIICQDQMNDLLRRYGHLTGVAFAKAVINEETNGMKVIGLDKLDPRKRYLFASNHPLGGMDGMALIAALGDKFDGNIRFVVNDLLMMVKPLEPVFLPINKHGGQSKEATEKINREYESDNQILYFPAGFVSRRQKGGIIQDLHWHKSFIVKARQYEREIVPIYFEGLNSKFFYNFSYWRMRLGIKFNIDILFLPRELFNKKQYTFNIYIGDPIPCETFDDSRSPYQWAQWIKQQVYQLKERYKASK